MNRNRKQKNRKKETAAAVSLLLASSLIFGGCGTTASSGSSAGTESASTESSSESASTADTSSESVSSENTANPMESASTDDIDFNLELTESTIDTDFTDREQSGTYKTSEAVKITLNKNTATVSGNGAEVDGSTITITEEGVYVVSGTLEDGQIIVDASDSDKVQIVLDGASINCETNAAIYVREADKVFITLAEGSENTLSSGTEYTQIDDNTVDGLDSNGSLLVTCGITIVYGPTSDGDGALDYDGGATVTGGTLAAIGSAGMTQGFGEDSTQPSITYCCTETQSADTTITLTDSKGNALFTVTPEKAYASIVLTFPDLTLDETYTLTAGTDTEEITITDTLTTAGTQPTKTMGDGPGGGNMPNNGDSQGTPPSKPDDASTTDSNNNNSDNSTPATTTTEA